MTVTVLLCDTPEGVTRLQYHLLKQAADVLVEVATDPYQAVETAARTRPDVVVANLELEGVGGGELVRRLRASAPGSGIVAWTAATGALEVAEVLASGASGFVFADEDLDQVVAAMNAAVAGGVGLSPAVAALLGDEIARLDAWAGGLQTELEDLRDEVARGTTAKADFLANISHELRTPVTVAKGIAYVLRNPSVPLEERDEFLDQLQGSLDKLMGIVDEIIAIAELERGTFELQLADLDLAPLVRNAVEEVAREYPSVAIEAQIAERLQAEVDGSRIGGVIRELLDNGCRFSPPDRPVELVARALDEGVVISITDRGSGMDRGIAAQAFEQPFSTGEATLRKEKAGVGVGLHLSRQLILEHGGIMWTDPLPGGGTRVGFCIPTHAGQRLSARPAGAA